jgi:mRNA interferase MazF
MAMVIKRFDVWLADLNLVVGNEISKIRPCLVISPDEVNGLLSTVTVAAMTTMRKPFPHRVDCIFQQKEGQIALDHIRSISKQRLIKRLGAMDQKTSRQVCDILTALFSFE